MVLKAASLLAPVRWQLPTATIEITSAKVVSTAGAEKGSRLAKAREDRRGGRGGMEYAGMTTAMYMYRTAFEFNDFGLASAISWFLFVIIAVLTWLTNRAFKDRTGTAT